MARILKGADVTAALQNEITQSVAALKEAGVFPCLAIVRAGEKSGDIAYENGAARRCEKLGVAVRKFFIPETAPQDELLSVIAQINADATIHGCLLLRPLPRQFDDETVRNALCPAKDVDGITDASLAGVFAGTGSGFAPCTPSACIEILDHYGVALKGRKAVVIGRSLVVGKPAAMMLLGRDATATVCHTKTRDMPAICRQADVLVVAAGRAGIIGREYFSSAQTVIDVGINADGDGKLCGDVNFAEAEAIVDAITPVPGGVGAVTTCVLIKHVVEAARRQTSAL